MSSFTQPTIALQTTMALIMLGLVFAVLSCWRTAVWLFRRKASFYLSGGVTDGASHAHRRNLDQEGAQSI